MNRPNPDFITNLARAAGAMILEASLKPKNVSLKEGWGNLVTEADVAIEKKVIASIQATFPDHQFLSEEGNSSHKDPEQTEHLWIIDPIDGTNNFVFGRDFSCIAIAYAEKGIILFGCVYDPFHDEMYFAEKGKGTLLNGKKIMLPERADDHRWVVSSDSSNTPETIRKHLITLSELEPAPWVLMRGSAALALSWIASGKIDVYFHYDIKAWDMAAGLLIAEEAGAIGKKPDGSRINFISNQIVVGRELYVDQVISQITL